MDKDLMAAMFQSLPEDKMLNALNAVGIRIDKDLVAGDGGMMGDAMMQALSNQDQNYSWKDEKVPVSGDVKRPALYDKAKVFPLNIPKLQPKDHIGQGSLGHDPELDQFAAIHNAQGGM